MIKIIAVIKLVWRLRGSAKDIIELYNAAKDLVKEVKESSADKKWSDQEMLEMKVAFNRLTKEGKDVLEVLVPGFKEFLAILK